MNAQNVITIIIGSVLTVLPQLLPAVPAEFRDGATAVIAAANALWHLWQPSPSKAQTPNEPPPVVIVKQ